MDIHIYINLGKLSLLSVGYRTDSFKKRGKGIFKHESNTNENKEFLVFFLHPLIPHLYHSTILSLCIFIQIHVHVGCVYMYNDIGPWVVSSSGHQGQ